MKRVIICLDGTWNDKRTGPDRTNVAKICDAVAPQDRHGTKQDAHYVEGIATRRNAGTVTTVHVLAWDPDEHALASVALPTGLQ